MFNKRRIMAFCMPFISFLVLFSSFFFAQANKNRIEGIVKNRTGVPLFGANVFLYPENKGTSTDINGRFVFTSQHKDSLTLKVSYVGFETKFVRVKSFDTKIIIQMDPKIFNLGGIEVVAEEELIPVNIPSTTIIKSGEIEHLQATSLREVLELVPGVQKSKILGLGKTSQISIRSDESDPVSAFGTKIVIDDVPESNNANLQFELLTGSKFGINNIGGGIDLRTIPADNIEKVEVISGIPSVRYGDLTEGIIKIETKSGSKPHRVKLKNNPNTSEINFSGGIPISADALNYNLNIARSERDKRLDGDEYTRYTGQLTYSFRNDKIKNRLKFSTQFIRDEQEPKNDLKKTKNYNRSYSFGFSDKLDLKFDDKNKLLVSAFLKWKKIDSKRSSLVQSDLRILPNGDTVSVYMGTKYNKGMEWHIGARVEYENEKILNSFVNKFTGGIEFNYEANTGDGIVFDTLYNPYGGDSKMRPRSFDDIPGYYTASLYAENNITSSYLLDWKLSAGLRLDLYQPRALSFKNIFDDGDFISSKQGSYLNPRVNLMVYLSKNSQIRLGAGKSSKAPSLNRIYPMPKILSWKNPLTEEIESIQFSQYSDDLKASESVKYELSFDHKFLNKIGVSLTGYYSERFNSPSGRVIPVFRKLENEYYYVGSYSVAENIGESISKGIEAKLKSVRFAELNTTLNLTFSYSRTKNLGKGSSYKAYPDLSIGQVNNYQLPDGTYFGMIYKKSGKWQEKYLMNYNLSYKNKEVGLWISFRAEHLIKTAYQYFDLIPVDVSKLSEDALADREFSESLKTKPQKWLFSFNISKSLFTGAEVSFYVNNFLDDQAIHKYLIDKDTYAEEKRNPDIFYGIEFSMILNEVF